jgi:hypothetical protein
VLGVKEIASLFIAVDDKLAWVWKLFHPKDSSGAARAMAKVVDSAEFTSKSIAHG